MSGDKIRAVRNNNPCNIERGDPWQGLMAEADKTADQKAEQRFCVFASPKWGFRAAARILIAYQDKHGINTIAGIVARLAPPNENDTRAYTQHVCDLTEWAADKALDLHAYSDVAPVVKALATHECGGWFFDDADLKAGLILAGLQPPPEALAQSRTVKTAAASTAGAGGIIMIAETAQQLAPAVAIIKQIHDWAPMVAVCVLIAALALAVYFRWDDLRRAVR